MDNSPNVERLAEKVKEAIAISEQLKVCEVILNLSVVRDLSRLLENLFVMQGGLASGAN